MSFELGIIPHKSELILSLGKTVVCIISGGNNDFDRMQEIKERSLLHDGLNIISDKNLIR